MDSSFSLDYFYFMNISLHIQPNIHKIELVQRKAIRWTLSKYSAYESVTDTQLKLNWRALEQRRADARLCMLYEIISLQHDYLHISSLLTTRCLFLTCF